MPSFDTLKKKQTELIRKAVDGSVFVAPMTAPVITTLTTYSAGPPVVIDLTALNAAYKDVGYTTEDGAGFTRDVSTSDITSWGATTPTRSDITSDTTTVAFTAQETNITTIGLGTGMDMTSVAGAANTGEVSLQKPLTPSKRQYRVLVLAVDKSTAGDIYIARFLPKAEVTSFSDQAFGGGDAPIEWGVTMTAQIDSTAGYSERWLFGGPGWRSMLVAMGFPAPT